MPRDDTDRLLVVIGLCVRDRNKSVSRAGGEAGADEVGDREQRFAAILRPVVQLIRQSRLTLLQLFGVLLHPFLDAGLQLRCFLRETAHPQAFGLLAGAAATHLDHEGAVEDRVGQPIDSSECLRTEGREADDMLIRSVSLGRHHPATRLPYDSASGRGGGRRIGSHVHH
jgi:hypothetical protein